MAISALRRLCVPFLVVAVAIALLALSSGGSTKAHHGWTGAPEFQPIFDFRLCNDLPPDFSGPAVLQGPGVADPLNDLDCRVTTDTAAGAVADITADFLVPQGHMNYAQDYYVTAGGGGTPPATGETRLPGPVGTGEAGTNADDTGLPGGGLKSDINLGLLTNPCDYPIHPDFIWWDAETDPSGSDAEGANTITCQDEGTANRWVTFATLPDVGDTHYGQADADSPLVTGIPDCSLKLFDPDGNGDDDGTLGTRPAPLHWRGAGLTQVPPGGSWQMLQNFEFEPGVLQATFAANPNTTNHPFAKLGPELGYINLITLNDPTTVILELNTISDFCSELATQGMIKGQIGATARITQPTTAGSYMAQARTMSYRDVDGDGLENTFDSCVWTPNIDDPYVTNGGDFDMMDPACDEDVTPPLTANPDEDDDGYLNNQDYCPKIGNPLPKPGGEWDSESATPYNTANPDGGPRQDQIGDDCDSEQGGNDTVSNGLYFNAMHVDSVCLEGGGVVDGDDDGWCDDLDPDDANANDPTPQLIHTPMDSAGIVFPAILDTDGDGTSNLVEWNNYPEMKYPGIKCSLFPGLDPWPADIEQTTGPGVINILDVNQVLPPAFGSSPGIPDTNGDTTVDWSPRLDLAPSSVINILDVNQVLPPTFGKTCP